MSVEVQPQIENLGQDWRTNLTDPFTAEVAREYLSATLPGLKEYSIESITRHELSTGLGRYAIFKTIVAHQNELYGNEATNYDVFAGIEGIGLVLEGRLISNSNPLVDVAALEESFFGTTINYWQEVISEAKYSPFTYLDKGLTRGVCKFPMLIGYNPHLITPAYRKSSTYDNIQWRPIEGMSILQVVRAAYYLTPLFRSPPR